MLVIEEIILFNQFYQRIKKSIMKNQIIPSLWFDNQALEAFEYYTEIFPNSSIYKSSPIVVEASIMGVDFIGINGGPIFKPNPSISFMPIFEDKEDIDRIWLQLIDGGTVMMPLQAYPWSAHYGWVVDKYGFNWQLYLGELANVNNQAIVPTFMFCGEQQGNCQEALNFYSRVFKDFESQGILPYPDGAMKGQVMHAQFKAQDVTLAAMDSGVPQDFSFNEGVSMTITCKDQAEIDYYWEQMTANGEESQCGWCKDPYGVSWQIVPQQISKILQENPDAGAALMRMKKIDIAALQTSA